MSAFSDDEKQRLLGKLRRAAAERRRVQADPALRKPVVPPGKWDFPIGLDDDGKPFPVEPGPAAPGR